MSEVTFETFREAALKAVTNLDDPDKKTLNLDERMKLKEAIRSILSEEKKVPEGDEGFVRRVSEKVKGRLAAFLWPEQALEVKRRVAGYEVESEAFGAHVLQEIRSILAEEKHG